MIVVDTNVIGYLFLNGGRSAQAERAVLKDPRWAAPLLWRSEFRSVLALYMRKGILAPSDASQIMDAALELMRGGEYKASSTAVLELVAASSCSAYDCEFVALAKDLDVPLVTEDREILAAFPGVAVSLDAFWSLISPFSNRPIRLGGNPDSV